MIAAGLSAAFDRLRQALVLTGVAAITATMILILCDVVLRKLGTPIPGVYEVVVNYLMPAAAFLPLVQVEKDGQMISVEIISSLGGDGMQAALGRFAIIVSVAVYGALAHTTLADAMNHYAVGSYMVTMDMRLPTWPAYFLLPLAFAAAGLAAAQRLFRAAPHATPSPRAE